jgi:hypothetical protein
MPPAGYPASQNLQSGRVSNLLVLLYPLQPQPILQRRQDVTRTMVIKPGELAPFLPTRAAPFLL